MSKGGCINNSRFRKAERNKDAKERQEVRVSRSPHAQLVELDRRLGTGLGAKRERAKLAG